MKKKMIGLITLAFSLVVVLAACAPGQGGSTVLNLRAVSNYWTSPGNYVVCDNFTTDIETTFSLIAGRNVERIRVTLDGDIQESSVPVDINRGDLVINGNTYGFTIRLTPGSTPFSAQDISTQGIIVVPINPADPPAKQGTVTLSYEIFFEGTTAPTSLRTTKSFDVWGACEEPTDTPSDLNVNTNYWYETSPRNYEYVVCDNLQTNINSSFLLTNANRINRVEATIYGVAQDLTTSQTLTSGQLNISNGRVSFTHPYGPGTVPFSTDLTTQAIIVTPTDPAAQQGIVELTYRVYLNDGSSFSLPTRSLEVWGACVSA